MLAASAQAAFPGTNGRIAFQRGGVAGSVATNTNIFAMDPTGLNQTALTADPSLDSSAPAYSADGKKIAFVRDDPTAPNAEHIFVMNADGSNPTQLTTDTKNDSHPTFSPDGTKIAYGRDNPDRIFVMDSNGANQHAITSGAPAAANPAWSPDGTKIAFQLACTLCAEDGGIFVMSPDGTNQTQLTDAGGQDGDNYPNWSPDGKKIAFSRDFADIGGVSDSGGEFIFVMNADGTNPTQLTDLSGTALGDGADDIMPAFSPDGTQITFRREATQALPVPLGDSFILTMDANGLNQTQRTLGFEDQKPDWQPIPIAVVVPPPPPPPPPPPVVKRPRITVRRRCVPQNMRVAISVSLVPVKTVTVFVDGSQVRKTKHSTFLLKLGRGGHRLRIVVVDTTGRTTTTRRAISHCPPKHRTPHRPAPKFTG